MEGIEFKYMYKDSDDEGKEIRVMLKDEHGLCCSRICEAFRDFMISAGFNEGAVEHYFKT